MAGTSRESEDRAVKGTLLSAYTNPLIKEARDRQDDILTRRFVGVSRRIADVGCGDGYHGAMFGPSCELYHGFEIAPEIAQMARERLRESGVDHGQIILGDVGSAVLQDAFYDLVLCLYFTAGNFREPSDDLSVYTPEVLDRNPGFIRVISNFYTALQPGGVVLLTVYKDVPEAEAAQIDFYLNTGQHPITEPGSRFVATREGFWSVRWTERSMLSNLRECGIAESQVTFHDLNAIAWLVEIAK